MINGIFIVDIDDNKHSYHSYCDLVGTVRDLLFILYLFNNSSGSFNFRCAKLNYCNINKIMP